MRAVTINFVETPISRFLTTYAQLFWFNVFCFAWKFYCWTLVMWIPHCGKKVIHFDASIRCLALTKQHHPRLQKDVRRSFCGGCSRFSRKQLIAAIGHYFLVILISGTYLLLFSSSGWWNKARIAIRRTALGQRLFTCLSNGIGFRTR